MIGRRYDLAEALLVTRLLLEPNDVWSLIQLGIVYRSKKQYKAAEVCYLRALRLSDNEVHLHSNYGNLLVDMDRPDEAVFHTQRAVELNPDDFAIRKNYAIALKEAKRFKESYSEYSKCLRKSPDNQDLRLDMANIAFYMHDIDTAWDLFDARIQLGKIDMVKPEFLPVWKGEELKGKRLLLCAEQGFGDTILMTRFLPLLKDMGAQVTFGCKAALHDLFSQLGCRLVPQGNYTPTEYDYQIPMMSLPLYLEKDWLKWPDNVPLHVTESAAHKFSWLKDHHKDALRVGILWSGSVTFAGNDKRAVSYTRFLELAAALSEVQFYSFQKGPCEKDYETHGRATILPLGHMLDNFSETAAALSHMDLVVMTDSALCHLAGTQNIPVLDLLQYLPYWLYMPESHRSSVYDSVRFLRQEKPGDWDVVFEKTKTILSGMAQAKLKNKFSVLDYLDKALLPTIVTKKKKKETPARAKSRRQ